jgi:hypothetical protein
MNPLRISITISDPWEVGESVNCETLSSELLQTQDTGHGGKALVRFKRPLRYRGQMYYYAVASPRHEGRFIHEIEAGKSLDCALTGISDEQAHSSSPMDMSKWRGGLAVIADIKPVP